MKHAEVSSLLFSSLAAAQAKFQVPDLGVVQRINRDELPLLPMGQVKESLGLPKVTSWDLLEIDRWLSDEGSIALLEQRYDGVEVVGTTITVELARDGNVIRTNHAWLPAIAPICQFRDEVARAVAMDQWAVDELEPVYWPSFGGGMECAFRSRNEMFTHIVSVTGEILEDSDSFRNYSQAQAEVRYRTYSPGGTFPVVSTQISQLFIAQEPVWFSSDCRFVLADVATPHTLGRVMDDNGLEYEFVGPCSSVPSFTSTNGDSLREAGHFFVAQKTRNTIGSTMWQFISPQRSSDVQINFDMPDPYCGACFNTVLTDIYLHTNATGFPDWPVTAHEYGHYISWSYGGSSNACTFRVNEGGSVEEAIADVVRMAYLRANVGTTYFSPLALNFPRSSQFTQGIVQAPHNNTQYSDRCANIYNHSGPFSQAMWEVLNGTNFGVTPATSLPYVNPATIDWSRALQAMSLAMNALGPDVTYEQFITRMSLSFTVGPNRTSFLNVFRHHGFNV